MPGMTLIGEALTFAHDAQLLGFCLDDTDEPEGDDFHSRCKDKLLGRWIDSRDPQFSLQELETSDSVDDDVDTDDMGEMPDEEVRTMFVRFCAMSEREQAKFMYDLTMYTCALIGVSVCDWEPSDEFILDAIQNGFSDAELRRAAYAAYMATPHPMEFNPSDEDVDLIGREDDDLIRIGHMSAQRSLNIDYRFSNRGFWMAEKHRHVGPRSLRSRRRSYRNGNPHAHCEKYGRQDYRHELPRREAKFDRRLAVYEAEEFTFWCEHDELIEVQKVPYKFLTVREQMRIPIWLLWSNGPATYEELDAWQMQWSAQEWEQRETLHYFHGFGHNDQDQHEEFTQEDVRFGRGRAFFRNRAYQGFRSGVVDYDPYDDYADCTCSACVGSSDDWDSFTMESEFFREDDDRQSLSLIDRFGNLSNDDRDDIFEGFGQSDSVIDRLHIGHSSRMRFTGRYRGLSSMV